MRLNYEAGLWLPLFQSRRAAHWGNWADTQQREPTANSSALQQSVHSTLNTLQSTVPQNYSATRSAASGKNIFSTSTIIPLKVRCPRSRCGQCVCGSNTIFKTPRPSFRHKSRDGNLAMISVSFESKIVSNHYPFKIFLNSKDKSSLKIGCSVGSGRNVVFCWLDTSFPSALHFLLLCTYFNITCVGNVVFTLTTSTFWDINRSRRP